MTATAYTVENKKLKKLWMFDTGTSTSAAGYGCGNHNSMPADVDGDGKQEIITGASCIDHDGTLLWTTGQGHGDAMHVGDLDPSRPGLEVWICHEDKPYGVSLLDAATGQIIFHKDGSSDTGRCCADNVWAGNPGSEFWGLGNDVYDSKGNLLDCRRPAINFLSYWDGDLEREILDGYTDSPATITKMSADGKLTTLLTTDGYYTCNTTKGTPCLSADIFGDWREELIVRAANHKSIRIYTTTYDTDYRITTLMHDAQYRMQVSAQQTVYNQPPHASFFLGTGYDLPARTANPVNDANPSGKQGAVIDTAHKYRMQNFGSGLYLEVADGVAAKGTNVQQGNSGADGWYLEDAGDGYYRIMSELEDGKTYLLDLDYGNPDNGTNIGIWTDTVSDAQLFKFVDNGDGTYTITTKATKDGSCIGITAGSTEVGANVVQWACDGSDNQKWVLEIFVDPLNGKLFKNLIVEDTNTYKNWSIDSSAAVGDAVFGDRDVTYTAIPNALLGAEMIVTACDAKYSEAQLATFTAGANMTVYVAMDNRVSPVPAWLGSWTKTNMQLENSADVTFDLYKLTVKSGEKVILGTNGQSGGCVNYTVLAVADSGGSSLVGDVDQNGTVTVADLVMLQKYLLTIEKFTQAQFEAGDLNQDGKVNASDFTLLKRILMQG